MWDILTEEQKEKYKTYCDSKFGKTYVFCETGEPMYMDRNGYLINTKDIIKLLFSICEN